MEDEDNPFAILDIWSTSNFAQHEINLPFSVTEPWYNVRNDSPLDQGIEVEGNRVLEDIGCLKIALPDLSNFEYGQLESLEVLETFSVSSTEGATDGENPVEDDAWIAPHTLASPQHPVFKSWEIFHDEKFKESGTVYFSESGPDVFDAALKLNLYSSNAFHQEKQTIIDSDPFLKALAQLGLGRESTLFKFNSSKEEFQQVIEGGRMSGFSGESFSSLIAKFRDYGNGTKRIEKFVNKVYTSNNPFPTLVSLANASTTILSVLQTQTGSLPLSMASALQLQSVFQRHGLILAYLDDIVKTISSAQSDGDLLSRLYNLLQDHENTDAGIQNLGLKILGHVSIPWLRSVSYWLGISRTPTLENRGIDENMILMGEGKRGSESKNNIQDSESHLRQELMPSFLIEDDAIALVETSRSLQLLRIHKSQHPIVSSKSVCTANSCTLEWQFSWRDAERVANQAEEYERKISEAIKKFHMSEPSGEPLIIDIEQTVLQEVETSSYSREAVEAQIAASNSEIELPIFPKFLANMDPLEQAVARCRNSGHMVNKEEDIQFAPPLALIPLLSFNPIISAQAHLVNHACLRLLFKEHNIRLHLSIQHRYSLFGDAVFATRLSHALFDPEMQSAERRKGQSRSGVSGLRLGSRDTWPPASSELRLALMGILTDSFHSNNRAENSAYFNTELPGGLSFAVREMSEDDFKRCMDPDSIEALDFLQLQYRSPAFLDVVITSSCLAKYDSLFKLLLRGTRMLYVVNQFFRDSKDRSSRQYRIQTIIRKFKLEAQHLVSTICSFFFAGIKSNWDVFSQRLDEIEEGLDQHDSQQHEGLHGLRDFHEKVLDRMMFAVFLRKRQEQVMRLIEEIFSTILVFARLSRIRSSGTDVENADDTKIEKTYHRFTKKVRVFVSVCKGLSERRGLGGSNTHESVLDHDGFRRGDMNEDGGNTVSQLLLSLDMNGYYSTSMDGVNF